MTAHPHDPTAAGHSSRRLFAFNGGFFTQPRLKRMIALAGYDLKFGKPSENDLIAVWGQSPTSGRGAAVSDWTGSDVVYFEDAFLRSLHPGRVHNAPPIGIFIDHKAPHFDPSVPSDLEVLLATHPLDDSALLNRSRGTIARIKEAHLTKYTANDPDIPAPDPGYVLVIDQTRGDASVIASKANDATFREMLVFAQEEHPGCRVLIKTHPETAQGARTGYFGPDDETARVSLCTDNHSPWTLFDGAVGVYTVSSQMGFEAIFAGHKPRIFGQPAYAGWGLTVDERPVPRRQRVLTRAQLFAATMILYPTWYDPHRDQLCDIETAISALEAETRAWRADHHGWNAHHMRLWKRKPLQKIFGRYTPMTFDKPPMDDHPNMVWGLNDAPAGTVRVEDGFLRSRGLGAELVPPLSLVCDDMGIYYDPSRKSRLEHLIVSRVSLRPDQMLRAEKLIERLCRDGLSKYNLQGDVPVLPEGRKILVPGQVEDDASILCGAGTIRTNFSLLEAVRRANPDAIVIYKPHPDVQAGLRSGIVQDAETLADVVIQQANMAALLGVVDEVWTITSGTGFEALLRGRHVVTYGAPFYAGWGLTRDLGDTPTRRTPNISLTSLVHATLIDYPRYHDPVSDLPCSVEVAMDRLASGDIPHPGRANRILSKLQGLASSYAAFWR